VSLVADSVDKPESTPATKPTGGRIVANLGALSVAQITTWTLTLAWTIFVPRSLGPSGTGLLVLVWSVNGLLVTLCGLGSKTLLVRTIARDRTLAPQMLATAMVVRAASAVPCVALVLLYAVLGRFHPPESYALYLAAALTVLMLLTEPLQAAFQGIEQMRYLAFGEIVNKGLISILGIALVFIGFQALTLAWLMVAAAAVVLLLYWLWLRPYVTLDWQQSFDRIRQYLRLSVSYWAYTIFHSVYLWGDSAMIGVLAPAAVLGFYGVPVKLYGTLVFLATILSTVWFPRMSAAFVHGPDRLRSTARAPLELVLVLGLPVSVGAAAVSEPLLLMLYGPAFRPAIPVMVLLAATMVPLYLNIILPAILVAAGRQNACTVVLAGGTCFNLLANVVLIRHFQAQSHNGAIGAAIALLATEALMATVALVIARRYIDWTLLLRVGRSLLATAGMAALVLLVARFGLVVQVVTGALSFALLALLLGVVTRQERELGLAFTASALKRLRRGAGSSQPTPT
jgi:O-antigen/teichoic acid export membrane protein